MKQLLINPNSLQFRRSVLAKTLPKFGNRRNYGLTFCQVRHLRKESIALGKLLSNYNKGLLLQRPELSLGSCLTCCYSTDSNKKPDKEEDGSDKSDKNERQGVEEMFTSFITALKGSVVLACLFYIVFRPELPPHMNFSTFEEEYLMRGRVKGVTLLTSAHNPRGELAFVELFPDPSHHSRNVESVFVDMNEKGAFEQMLNNFEKTHNVRPNEKIPIRNVNNSFIPNESAVTMMISLWYSALLCTIALMLARHLFSGGRINRLPKYSLTSNKPSPEQKPPKKKESNIGFDVKLDKIFSTSLKRGDHLMKDKFSFKDVVGMNEAKVEILEFVQYLKDPSTFQALGAKPPTGALLLGPPGCGKTLLAKALAGECDVPFYFTSGSEFICSVVGQGSAQIRNVFKEARENAPSIIYIDEVDALGRKRDGQRHSDTENTLNQLLVELDGMNERRDVIVLASTNRADVLDKALLRPGRFDRHILIDLPTQNDRVELFELYLGKLKLGSPVATYSHKLAQLTPGMSGADIANICNEAAIHAAREMKKVVTARDFDYAIERVIAGAAKKSNVLAKGERKLIAFHESGHALVGWLLEHTDALLKVTIVPRTSNIAGFAQYLPQENNLYSREQLMDRMCMALGGRVAESIIFNDISSGAQDDLDKVTQLAYKQITSFGMSKNFGLMTFPEQNERGFKPYSRKLKNAIDLEARQLVAEAYKRTEKILLDNNDKLHKLANLLLEKETINATEVEHLIGPPPFGKKNFVDPTILYDEEVIRETSQPNKKKAEV